MVFLKYFIVVIYILIVLFISRFLSNKFDKLVARKFVHIFESLVWFLNYYLFGLSIHFVLIPIFLFIANFVSEKIHMFDNLNAGYKSYGIACFLFSLAGLSFLSFYNASFFIPSSISILVLAFGDGLSPFIGMINSKFNIDVVEYKKLFSFIFIVLMTFIILFIFKLTGIYDVSYVHMILLSILASLLEIVGSKGFDNITLPLGLTAILYFI